MLQLLAAVVVVKHALFIIIYNNYNNNNNKYDVVLRVFLGCPGASFAVTEQAGVSHF